MNDTALAQAVGCSRERICAWSHMQLPPSGMRKSLDIKLANALKTDRETLFNGYLTIAPQVAPIISQPITAEDSNAALRRVLAMVELMPNDGLKELARVGEQLLRGGMLQVA